MKIHEGLIEVARQLATADTSGRPRQANLRRAVSSAYYALFHFLIDQACGLMIGKGHSLTRQRHSLARAFEHTTMSKTSEQFSKTKPSDRFANAIGNHSIPPAVRMIATVFVELQQNRHEADYDLNKTVTRPDTLKLVDQAENAIANCANLADDPVGRIYLAALLAGNRFKP